jgi:sodium/hydrogen antiporter
MTTELAVLALLVAGYALLANRLERWSTGAALVFVVIGIVLSEDALGGISIQPAAEPIKILAEATLTLLLFADASTVRVRALRQDARVVAKLLVVGLLLTILLGTAGALLLFPGISLGIALLIGAVLAPTDAALGQAVVTNRTVPARIRRVLNVESGLNDGIVTPIVFFALALATAEAGRSANGLVDALLDLGIGTAVGVLLGAVGGLSLLVANRRGWTSSMSRQLFVLTLAAGCYLAAVALGGNGFIGAFVGGLAFGRATAHSDAEAVEFTETQGSLLAIGVWTAFGLTLAGQVVTHLGDVMPIVYAVLSLTIIRMLPVAIALLGERFQPMTMLFVGWFGPRGLASIVFLVIGLEGLEHAGVDSGPLAATVAWTVLLSVVLHGLTARPLAAWYGSRVASLASDAPELHDSTEPRPTRQWLTGVGRPIAEPSGEVTPR